MKLRIKKRDLLAQMPKEVAYMLIASVDGLPDYFELEAEYYENPKDKENDKRKAEYETVYKILTPKEWQIFGLIERCPDGVSIEYLCGQMKSAGSKVLARNNLAIHVKGIRRKFERALIPLQIINVRGSAYRGGMYALVKK